MAHLKSEGDVPKNPFHSPTFSSKDPSLPASIPTTSKGHQLERINIETAQSKPFGRRCCKFLYNKDDKTCCGRTCLSWLYITIYSIVYFCFLSTFTLILLYFSLWIVKITTDFKSPEKIELLTYSEYGVGLSATPTAESSLPIIWYRRNNVDDYEKYVKALDNLLIKKRRKRDVKELGTCGVPPYGYGNNPCVILRINKNLRWSGKPIEANSTAAKMAPIEVQNWIKKDAKLWMHCRGYHPYDNEHIGRILYYPDPPGIDPSVFPLGLNSDAPLIAIQISGFTLGVSLAVECKLWYANGPSSIEFMLYVASDDRTVSNRTSV